MSFEMHAIVKGRVQGVGFRAMAKLYAEKLKITGFVRNLEDGDVEICAQGQKTVLEKLIEQLRHEFGGRILEVLLEYNAPSQSFSGFQIL